MPALIIDAQASVVPQDPSAVPTAVPAVRLTAPLTTIVCVPLVFLMPVLVTTVPPWIVNEPDGFAAPTCMF